MMKMGMLSPLLYTTVDKLNFRMYTDEEIDKISILKITDDKSFNDLGHVYDNGLYDLHLGSVDCSSLCKTCSQRTPACAGHCGRIDLSLSVYNPLFYHTVRDILNRVCLWCCMFQVTARRALSYVCKKKLLSMGRIEAAAIVDTVIGHYIGERTVEVNDEEESAVTLCEAERLYDKEIITTRMDALCRKFLKGKAHSDRAPTSYIRELLNDLDREFLKASSVAGCCVYCQKNKLSVTLTNSMFLLKKKKKSVPVTNEEIHSESETNVTCGREQLILFDPQQSYLTPEQVKKILREVWKQNKHILSALYPVLCQHAIEHPTDIFFMKKLLVIPPQHRPYKLFAGKIVEHETTVIYKNVIRLSKLLSYLLTHTEDSVNELPVEIAEIVKQIAGSTFVEKSQTVWQDLQNCIDNLLDSEIHPQRRLVSKGIRQIVEKKMGLFRRHLMGKRVNYSARSVAAPDPMLAVDEVGVPLDFAKHLTYPVPVTDWNVDYLRRLVINGPSKYPGALYIENEQGRRTCLTKLDEQMRIAAAKTLLTPPTIGVRTVNPTKIVFRHLQNGDYVLMNRQPTLHRPSIQAHQARVMVGDRVLRMPYANCKAYNADFDGDELNLHFPQNEIAKSEAMNIVTTHNQYLTPKDGTPLAGLIQDCVVASVMLTKRGVFFEKEDYHQLVFVALSHKSEKIEVLPPAFYKPRMLWTGKQIISTVLCNIIPKGKAKPSFTFRTSVKVDLWQTAQPHPWIAGGPPEGKKEAMTESEFVMRDGELLCGVVDKCSIGSTSQGLIHICYDLYGGAVASEILTAISRLCISYLQLVGHTISVREFVTPSHVSKLRRKELRKLIQSAPNGVSKRLYIPPEDLSRYIESLHMSGNEGEMASVDMAYTGVLGSVTSDITLRNEKNLYRKNLDNHMRMMVDTGAKGSKVNMNQMASLFGSVALDGKRMPVTIMGKSLPSFKPYDTNPRAGGYIPGRFITGMDPQAYFFLSIVGRDSLQHTAVKTANSGYAQRCLVKHLEGIRVEYDNTVRNSDGLVLQFDYGEDGLDVTKAPFLESHSALDILVHNYGRMIDPVTRRMISEMGQQEDIEIYKRTIYTKKRKRRRRTNGFLKFCKSVKDVDKTMYERMDLGRTEASYELCRRWLALPSEERLRWEESVRKYADPVASKYSGTSNLGVVSETLESLIDSYYEDYCSRKHLGEKVLSKKDVQETIYMKALNSRVDPGEAVGAICAQALGEPLTQMTLNTFHFAGKDELNVTLGVPRMIEILRTASRKISTPIMEIPFLSHVTPAQAEKLRLKFMQVSLTEVLHKLHVSSKLVRSGDKYSGCSRIVVLRFEFLPYTEYCRKFNVNPARILRFIETTFISRLTSEITYSFHLGGKLVENMSGSFPSQDSRRSRATEEETEENFVIPEGHEIPRHRTEEEEEASSEEDEPNNEDAAAMSRKQKHEEQDYSDAEEEEEEDGEEKQAKEDEEANEDDIRDLLYQDVFLRLSTKVTFEEYRRRCEAMKLQLYVQDYSFDREQQLWCEVTFNLPVTEASYDLGEAVRRCSERCYVSGVPGIKRAFVVEKDGKLTLKTEGVNFNRMIAYEHLLDINCLYTNNIYLLAEKFGIEAAQRSIIREIRAVQSAYDIKVSFRHLTLLADYFTSEGIYKGCSRHAIRSAVSPIQKMSYETCFAFLKSALLQSEEDWITSPSATVALGQTMKMGTNFMQMLPILSIRG